MAPIFRDVIRSPYSHGWSAMDYHGTPVSSIPLRSRIEAVDARFRPERAVLKLGLIPVLSFVAVSTAVVIIVNPTLSTVVTVAGILFAAGAMTRVQLHNASVKRAAHIRRVGGMLNRISGLVDVSQIHRTS